MQSANTSEFTANTSTSWLVIGLGFICMYLPSLWDLFHGVWATEQQGHGPIVLAISIWLFSKYWKDYLNSQQEPQPILGWLLFLFSLMLYVFGRSQDILIFEIGSAPLLIIAVTLMYKGANAIKVIWFPLFFMLFMIPLPGIIVDTLTSPMKIAVSYVVEHILYLMNYPISRTGVMLQIGPYQLLVADACAGLHTLFTLEAMGLLYLNLVKHESTARNVALAIFVIPVSFLANVIRVMTLTLITYHFGDEVGQGFLHQFAGFVLFIAALLLIIAIDTLIRFFIKTNSQFAT